MKLRHSRRRGARHRCFLRAWTRWCLSLGI
jgi:hypothetical protein